MWSASLRLARVKRIWITTPAFDHIYVSLTESGARLHTPVTQSPTEAQRQSPFADRVNAFGFNGISVLRREHHYQQEATA